MVDLRDLDQSRSTSDFEPGSLGVRTLVEDELAIVSAEMPDGLIFVEEGDDSVLAVPSWRHHPKILTPVVQRVSVDVVHNHTCPRGQEVGSENLSSLAWNVNPDILPCVLPKPSLFDSGTIGGRDSGEAHGLSAFVVEPYTEGEVIFCDGTLGTAVEGSDLSFKSLLFVVSRAEEASMDLLLASREGAVRWPGVPRPEGSERTTSSFLLLVRFAQTTVQHGPTTFWKGAQAHA